MAKKRKGCCGCAVFAGASVAIAALGVVWLFSEWAPTSSGPAEYVRFAKSTRLSSALELLESKRVIKNVLAARVYATLTRRPTEIRPGTYQVKPGMTLGQLFDALKKPVRQMVRVPEGWWISRVAKKLDSTGVCSTEDYKAAAQSVLSKGEFAFTKGATSLDGYLFPDTYNLPPLTPAEDIVKLQLQTFEKKALPLFGERTSYKRTLTIASMVELEAGKDSERARIAGVIENRLKKGIRLEIDATVLYAMDEWKVLPPGVVRTVESPYNTYLHGGLPPGPIGSPGLKSIAAALKPEAHGYLYYVARPNTTHYFAATYPEHLANIKKARAEWRAAGGH